MLLCDLSLAVVMGQPDALKDPGMAKDLISIVKGLKYSLTEEDMKKRQLSPLLKACLGPMTLINLAVLILRHGR